MPEFPVSADGPWKIYVHDPDKNGVGTVKYPRLVAKDAGCAAKLKKRTLTNLYNKRPTWLANIHKRLDEAVFAALPLEPGFERRRIAGVEFGEGVPLARRLRQTRRTLVRMCDLIASKDERNKIRSARRERPDCPAVNGGLT